MPTKDLKGILASEATVYFYTTLLANLFVPGYLCHRVEYARMKKTVQFYYKAYLGEMLFQHSVLQTHFH